MEGKKIFEDIYKMGNREQKEELTSDRYIPLRKQNDERINHFQQEIREEQEQNHKNKINKNFMILNNTTVNFEPGGQAVDGYQL